MRRLLIAGLVLVALSVAGTVDAQAKIHAPPADPCTFQNRMDLQITSEGVWFECVCEALMIGTVCDWYELGPAPDAVTARKSWRYVSRRTQRQLAVVHSWPRYLDMPVAKRPAPRIITTPTGPVTLAVSKCSDPYLASDAWAQQYGC